MIDIEREGGCTYAVLAKSGIYIDLESVAAELGMTLDEVCEGASHVSESYLVEALMDEFEHQVREMSLAEHLGDGVWQLANLEDFSWCSVVQHESGVDASVLSIRPNYEHVTPTFDVCTTTLRNIARDVGEVPWSTNYSYVDWLADRLQTITPIIQTKSFTSPTEATQWADGNVLGGGHEATCQLFVERWESTHVRPHHGPDISDRGTSHAPRR